MDAFPTPGFGVFPQLRLTGNLPGAKLHQLMRRIYRSQRTSLEQLLATSIAIENSDEVHRVVESASAIVMAIADHDGIPRRAPGLFERMLEQRRFVSPGAVKLCAEYAIEEMVQLEVLEYPIHIDMRFTGSNMQRCTRSPQQFERAGYIGIE